MADDQSARYALPLLMPGQAQKELTHNEALAMIDLLLDPQVEAAGVTAPPSSPLIGQAWAIGSGATGAWAGQDGRLAGWTAGGWRFVAIANGATVRVRGTGDRWQVHDGTWTPPVAMAAVTGGTVVDVQVRAALADIGAALRRAGLITPA